MSALDLWKTDYIKREKQLKALLVVQRECVLGNASSCP